MSFLDLVPVSESKVVVYITGTIDKHLPKGYHAQTNRQEEWMTSKFQIGQRVAVKPAREQSLSLRDSSIEAYAEQTGEITDYYWISPSAGESFYIYTVRLSESRRIIVLHEDEMET